MYEFAVAPAVTSIRRRGVEIAEVSPESLGFELEMGVRYAITSTFAFKRPAKLNLFWRSASAAAKTGNCKLNAAKERISGSASSRLFHVNVPTNAFFVFVTVIPLMPGRHSS